MENRGENVEVVTDFLFLGSKITVNGYCSHEIKKQLLLGGKAMTNLDSVLKSRDIILPTFYSLGHLTHLMRNLYAGQEATVGTGHGTTDWFQIEKGVH